MFFDKMKGDHLFRDVDDTMRNQVVENVIEASTPRKSFFIMVAVSAIVCTAGLLMDSVALIIGSMLIAPMISAILSISLGIVVLNWQLFYRSLIVVWKSVLLLFVSAFGVAMLFQPSQLLSYEFLLKINFIFEIFIVALVVGFIATLSFIRKELSQYITGTAIAVTLIPPVCISAIALRMGYPFYFLEAGRVFLINLFGILISSILVFMVTKFYRSQRRVVLELKEEKRLLDKLTRKERLKKWLSEGLDILAKFFKR